MTLKSALLISLLLASTAVAQSSMVTGRLHFFNDAGTFMLDLGVIGVNSSFSGKLSGVKTKEGSAAAIRALIPTDARLQFKVTKVSSYPEGLLYFNGKDLGAWLVSKGLATRV